MNWIERMDDSRGGIDEFRTELSSAVVRDIETWRGHAELGRLYFILHAHTDRHTFLNTYAEAIVARHLLQRGCTVRFEVPTPAGRRADFEVAHKGVTFFLHVKRLNTQASPRARLTVSSRLRMLERIERPYIVSIRWREGVTDRQLQQFVTKAEQFIQHARIGDELAMRDDADGRAIGGVRIIAPSPPGSSHVTLVIDLPSATDGFIDNVPRMNKLLRKAYLQFMPRVPNVILMGTSHERDVTDFENALLGSHIERWDERPPKGRRIAHGRAEDGFWFGDRFSDSKAAAWFKFSLKEDTIESKLWLRRHSTGNTELDDLLRELFG
jgi:hypothetical protein